MKNTEIFNEKNLVPYLGKLKELHNCLVIIAVRDNAGYWLDENIQAGLEALGLKENLIKAQMVGYIAVIDSGSVVYENMAPGQPITYEGVVDGHSLYVLSAPFNNGDDSSIRLDGAEYGINTRGLNFVVFDKDENKVIDRVVFDAHIREFPHKRAKSHYDVCLAGFWYGANYGSLLNGYAEYCLLKDEFSKEILLLQKPGGNQYDQEITSNHNAEFMRTYYDPDDISVSLPYGRLKDLNDVCDGFIAGSDQIWNYFLSFHENMYLPFVADDKKLISFATSFGHKVDRVPDAARPRIKKYLSRYDAISVREQFDVDILKNNYGINGELVFEPVFCIDKHYYERVSAGSEIDIKEPYLLTYILDPTPQKREAILLYEKKLGIKAVNVLDGKMEYWDEHNKALDLPNTLPNVSTADFLKLFMNASFVITDSFHGTAFSIIFNKNFFSIGNYARGFERFADLLGRLKLIDRLVTDPKAIPTDDRFMKPIDYTETNAIIRTEAARTVEWFRKAVEMPKAGKRPSDENTVCVKLDMKLCSGCSACANACPKDAITMKPNEEGFMNPVIDYNKCVNCGVCIRKCTALNPVHSNLPDPPCYAMMADDETRMKSSSGGMFSVAAEYVLEKGGYVCGAAYNDKLEVEHIIISDKKDLHRLQGSKYIQSRTGNVYREIKALLEKDKMVLFTGMPCQVAGLYSYLGKDHDKLYTIDILCHGITSYKVFDKYHKDVHKGKPLSYVGFKEKKPWGWHAGVNAYFTDGTKYAQPLEKDKYFIAYLSSISKNTSCEKCRSNALPRQGDLTMGDFWGIDSQGPGMNDGKGTSFVLTNNHKGAGFFEELKPRMKKWASKNLQKAIPFNKIISHPYPLHRNRSLFFEYFDKLDFASLTDGCKNNSLFEKLLAKPGEKIPQEDMELYTLAKAAAENSRGRSIVTWIRSDRFENILMKYFGLKVAFGITLRREAIVPGKVLYYDAIKGRSNEFYLVSLDRGYEQKVYDNLRAAGYEESRDFVFRAHKPVVLENFDLSKQSYHDCYGNTVEGTNGVIEKIVMRGFNNHLHFGNNIRGLSNLTFSLGSSTKIYIGDDCYFAGKFNFDVFGPEGSVFIKIGKKCTFHSALVRIVSSVTPSKLIINNKCSFEHDLEIHANLGKSIVIGEDCMFSYNVNIFSGDGHSIFDVSTGKIINAGFDDPPNRKNNIVIGDHVWGGFGCFIMNGANIGSGSIIGSESVVKGVFPNNCALGGNPAKMIRTDIAWSRGRGTDIHSCGDKNIRRTSTAKAPLSCSDVLVVGGTKFMGVKLVEELLKRGNNVTIATRGNRPDQFGSFVNRLRMDVSDAESVKNALEGKHFDVVFDNLAYNSTNANNILSNVSCGKYVQLSSVEVYANKFCIDMKESDFDPLAIKPELCTDSAGYVKGKQQAEAYAYQKYPGKKIVTVRIPYVSPTERLGYYCKNIIDGKPMNIPDLSRAFTMIRTSDVGEFLPWIAAQDITGPVNFAGDGYITVQSILSYIEKKTGKKAIIDKKGKPAPFSVFKETSFSMNMDKIKALGYTPVSLYDWFWNDIDTYLN